MEMLTFIRYTLTSKICVAFKFCKYLENDVDASGGLRLYRVRQKTIKSGAL